MANHTIQMIFTTSEELPLVDYPIYSMPRNRALKWSVQSLEAADIVEVIIQFDDPSATYFAGPDPTRGHTYITAWGEFFRINGRAPNEARTDKYTIIGKTSEGEEVVWDPVILVTDP